MFSCFNWTLFLLLFLKEKILLFTTHMCIQSWIFSKKKNPIDAGSLFPAKLGATDDVGSSFGISLLSGSYHVLLSDATCAFLWTSSRCINLFYQNIKIKIGTTCILIQWPIEFFFFFYLVRLLRKYLINCVVEQFIKKP